jgi:hypothetical protein
MEVIQKEIDVWQKKKQAATKLRTMIKNYLETVEHGNPRTWCDCWNMEKAIYQEIKKHLKVILNKKERIVWGIISGTELSKKESWVIKEIAEKAMKNNGYYE